ncbi:CDP-diacylglycerol--inositol 3-phosphatidyltransferase [Metschnikowia bicuspidata var. bicuspidata NRRL YB-4993]|uniref:CDP-diacylglycerol--inositol 3-phosphatidyltransferase n=1 Tax=Metschnikowia bicuspidata var. bicuspidata NRRL YB-4993 TaxID=869754 RepID=A0A1A0HGD2_9ASCO|nr:CDP-diacylglycerol--inositol 3-phosphatidyltransferase [Metschnikowia bicuspidata var. bicuspidata NRRL YB-4993]OBA22913.1 CDP-diacylglycerol--inositol 3-phosphatidyltransferase [Metschnikowia bicuspidata var. bicuspidata NRRL YB-4993]
MADNQKITVQHVFRFIPNVIGYIRVLTAFLSFLTMKNHPVWTLVLYGISGFLDAFDGYAARKFDQGTRFGAVLDMVTDRCATSSLICYLCVIYPQYCVMWQLLVSLDLSSHYMHMYAMLSSGSTSHKNVGEKSKLLNLYYTNRKVLFFVCLVNELFYMATYLHYYNFFWMGTCLGWVSAPIWIFKQIANVVQLKNAALILAEKDALERSTKAN